VIRFFLHALDELAALPAPPSWTARVSAPAKLVAVDALLAADPSVLWDAPALEADGRSWTFLGWGEAARIEGDGEARLDTVRTLATELFAGLTERRHPELGAAPSARLFGGIAFRPESSRAAPWTAFRDASFTLPRWLYATNGERAILTLAVRSGERVAPAEIEAALARIEAASAGIAAGPAGARGAELDRTSPADWERMVEDALARIRAHEMEKVVPMTRCHVVSAGVLDVAAALGRVRSAYPECARFAFQRGETTFIGASPERLVALRGLEVEADSLAGSRARARDAAEDDRAVHELRASDKDLREHAHVAHAIERALRPIAREVRIPDGPIVRSLRNVHHLWTPIVATLAAPLHALDLVAALHPTPAVCGTPRHVAIDWIAAHEPSPRGWYAGAVGWFDAGGDGAFSVAIRSGALTRHEAWLYAGAGIVEGSDPTAEYAETRVKQTPMLAALGLLP
jgi:salicylate biosynthesis isochorismate synthase